MATIVQSSVSPASGTHSSWTLAFGSAVSSGDTVVIGVITDAGVSVTSVTDDKSNSYTVETAFTSAHPAGTMVYALLSNITNGPTTITVNLSSARYVSLIGWEISGLGASPTLDVLSGGDSSFGSGMFTFPFTTANSNELGLAFFTSSTPSSFPYTQDNGWTNDAATSPSAYWPVGGAHVTLASSGSNSIEMTPSAGAYTAVYVLSLVPSASSPTIVQSSVSPASGTHSSWTLAFGSAVSSGDTVVIGVITDAGVSVTSVTDDKSNSYTVETAFTSAHPAGTMVYALLSNITNGPTTITVNLSSARYVSLIGWEISGLGASPTLDVLSGGDSSFGSGMFTFPFTTANSNELGLAFFTSSTPSSFPYTQDNGWTNDAATSPSAYWPVGGAHVTLASSGSNSIEMTPSAGAYTAVYVLSLVPSGSGGPLSITTASLPGATVGSSYSSTLAASGGTAPYSWNLESASPNTDLWLRMSSSQLLGTPQMIESETITVRVTDAVGATVTGSFSLDVTASGALSIVTPGAGYYSPTASNGSAFSLKLLAQGGQPPYWWSFSGPAFNVVGSSTGTNYATPSSGWLAGAPITNGTDTVTVQVMDNNGATATQTVTITVASTLTFYPIDSVSGNLNLPPAHAGTLYQTQLRASGGTNSGYTYSIDSGALPSGLTLSSGGLITGTPSSAGNLSSCTVKVKDSAGNTATVPLAMNIFAKNLVTRPSYNTSTGFFVDANGYLRDPNGRLYQFRGLDRTHHDSYSWASGAGGALADPGVVRVFFFDYINGASAAGDVTSQYAPNYILTVATQFSIQGVVTTGSSSTALLASVLLDWGNNQSGLSGVMDEIVLNVANEWGPTASISWQYAHEAVAANLSGISGTTVTVNSSAATNPFANCPYAYISGATGVSNRFVYVSSPGGVSGAWTVQASTPVVEQSVGTGNGTAKTFTATLSTPVAPNSVWVAETVTGWYGYDNGSGTIVNGSGLSSGTINYSTGALSITFSSAPYSGDPIVANYGQLVSISGYTGGGTLNGGSVGVLRAMGYTCPIMMDSGRSGQDYYDIIDYAAAVNSSDTQRNCIFGYHSYGVTMPYEAPIASVTKGTSTVVKLQSNLPFHPFNPTGGSYLAADQYYISGAQGMTQLNGYQPASLTPGGSMGAWTITLSVNSSTWSNYLGGATIVTYGTASWEDADYRLLYQNFAALRSQGVCVSIMEFGPGNQSGSETTPEGSLNSQNVSIGQVVWSAEANQLSWCYWAWDDHAGGGGFLNSFSATNNTGINAGQYLGPQSLSAAGLEVVANPRYGLWVLSQVAASFL